MSVYSGGVEAYRDTTKWLTAFLPVATLISGGVLVGPGLVRSIDSSDGVLDWFGQNLLLLGCGLLTVTAVGVILWRGAAVLAVEPKDVAEIATGSANRSALATAIGNGATAPYFFDVSTFDASMAELANGWDNQNVVADDPRLARIAPAIEALREWSVFYQVKDPYKCFQRAFIAGTVVIAGSIIVSAATISKAADITAPTVVTVTVNETAKADFLAATGCAATTGNTYTAVGGTWERPRLEVDGLDCKFAASWTPRPGDFELRPVKQ